MVIYLIGTVGLMRTGSHAVFKGDNISEEIKQE